MLRFLKRAGFDLESRLSASRNLKCKFRPLSSKPGPAGCRIPLLSLQEVPAFDVASLLSSLLNSPISNPRSRRHALRTKHRLQSTTRGRAIIYFPPIQHAMLPQTFEVLSPRALLPGTTTLFERSNLLGMLNCSRLERFSSTPAAQEFVGGGRHCGRCAHLPLQQSWRDRFRGSGRAALCLDRSRDGDDERLGDAPPLRRALV